MKKLSASVSMTTGAAMERSVKVVLSFQRVVGLNYVQKPIVIVSSLNGNVLETDSILLGNSFTLESTLVWEMQETVFDSLLADRATIKVEIATIHSKSMRKFIGYLSLKLSSVDFGKTEVPYTWHKLSGTKPKAKSPKPQILLKLSAVVTNKQKYITLQSGKSSPSTMPHIGNLEIIHKDENSIQIGSENEYTEVLCLSLNAKKLHNIYLLFPEDCVFKNEKDGCAVNFTLFSKDRTVHFTETKTSPVSITIHASVATLYKYFRKNPYMMIRCINREKDLGICSFDLRKIVPTVNTSDFLIDFCDASDTFILQEKCVFISCVTNEIPTSTNGNKPWLDMEIKLKFVKKSVNHTELIPKDREVVKCYIDNLMNQKGSGPIANSYCDDLNSSLENVSKKINALSLEKPKDQINLDKFSKLTMIDGKNGNDKCYSPEVLSHSSEHTEAIKKTMHKIYNYSSETFTKHNIMEKTMREDGNQMLMLINELEDWMEKQREMFKFHLNEVEKQHLDCLNKEWTNKRSEYENMLIQNIEHCQKLIYTLNGMLDSIKIQEELLEDREKKLQFAKTELELDYRAKYQEVKTACREMENNFQHQLKLHQIEYSNVCTELKHLTQENASLKETLKRLTADNELRK